METDVFFTIKSNSQGIYKEKGSKFIALAFPVISEDEIKEILARLKKEYYDATHHCYAYRLGADKLIYRANDDGEPSGSAGKPILGQIQSKDLTNIFIDVIRYYGGVKLGVSGLINAYRTAAADALQNVEIIEKIVESEFKVEFDYIQMNDVMRLAKDFGLKQIAQDFQQLCSITLSVRKRDFNRVIDEFKKNPKLKLILADKK